MLLWFLCKATMSLVGMRRLRISHVLKRGFLEKKQLVGNDLKHSPGLPVVIDIPLSRGLASLAVGSGRAGLLIWEAI